EVGADELRGRLAVLAVDPGQHALPLVLVRTTLPAAVLIRELERLLGAMEDRVDRLLRQRSDGRVERELEAARESLEDRHPVLGRAARLLPRQHRALAQREVRVPEHQL